jgi:hypothetical protein
MAAHTPGPWSAKGHTVSCSKGVVVEVHDYPDATSEERSAVLADARLIAAAPQLLAACELVLALNDHPDARVPGYWREQPAPRGRPLLDPKAAAQLRDAITKARGT